MKIQYNFMLGLCLLSICIGVSSCATAHSIARDYHVVPTPMNAVSVPPCETPTWIIGEQEVCRFMVTPLPNEAVLVGSITVFSPTLTNQPQPNYTIQEDIPPWQPVTRTNQILPVRKLFIQDMQSSQEIRLGDEAGDAFLEIETSQYVIWRYQWNGRSETLRKTGLYAYVLETGEESVIAQHPDIDPWYPEIHKQWIVYADGFNDVQGIVNLRAHNLVTGEDFQIDDSIPHMQAFNTRPASDYYAISDTRIAWMSSRWEMNIYDLKTQTLHVLDVPNGNSSASDVDISGDIVIWWDKFWHGYDLQQETLFTIPIIPLGWENIAVQPASPVTIKDDLLYWSLKVNEDIYRFTAPIIRNQ